MGEKHPVFQTDTSRWPLISWIAAWSIYLGFFAVVILGMRWLGQWLTALLSGGLF